MKLLVTEAGDWIGQRSRVAWARYRGLARRRGLSLEDFTQTAYLAACVVAVDFDPAGSATFLTSAQPRVDGAILSLLRSSLPKGYRTPGARPAGTVVPSTTSIEPEAAGVSEPCLSLVVTDDDSIAAVDFADWFDHAVSILPNRDRLAVRAYHIHNLLMREVGAIIGLATPSVSRLLTRSYGRIHNHISSES